MIALSDTIFFATAFAYTVATALFVLYLRGRSHALDVASLAPRWIAFAAGLHTFHVFIAAYAWNVCPVRGMHFAFSVVSLVACLVYLVIRKRYRLDVVGAFLAPLSLTFLVGSRIVGGENQVSEASSRLRGAILPIHITVNLLGEALFMLAFAAAVTYLVQEKLLKQKRLAGVFQRLPPLDSLEKAEHSFLLAGFLLLTVGIVTGAMWAHRVEAGNANDVARAVFGYISWILFAAVLFLRRAIGWRGRRASYGTILGFAFVLLVLVLYLLRDAEGVARAL